MHSCDTLYQFRHHGYYDPDSTVQKTRLQAQLDMINNVLEFAGVDSAEHMVDVGCGIGGSSRCERFAGAEASTGYFCNTFATAPPQLSPVSGISQPS